MRAGGRHELLGVEEVVLRAHQIEDLAVPVPPAASALLRTLTVIGARASGLDDPELSVGEWNACRARLLEAGEGFEPEAVRAYFARYCWDLFDPVRPWLQDPLLASQCEGPAGVNALMFGRPTGNNLAWGSVHTDTEPVPVRCEEALQHLLIQHFYGPAGRCSPRTVNGRKVSNGTAGPLRGTVSFHPLGRTLFETLLAGLPPFTGEEQTQTDACPWEEPGPPDPAAPPADVTWPGRLLTGRSRRAVLLVPAADGRAVTDAFVTWSTQHPVLEATDPYLIYRTDTGKPVGDRRRRHARRAEADRAWWRDLDALLLAGDENTTVHRPTAFSTLNDLPAPVRSALRVRAHAFDQEPKTMDRLWYTAVTPPVFPWSQEHDPQRASHIARCRTAAEEVGGLLTKVAATAWRETASLRRPGAPPGPKKRLCPWAAKAREVYWARAESVFWRLLQGPCSTPPRPVFAGQAVAALRQVTAPALARHHRAAPALARAVSVLLADPHTPTGHTSEAGKAAA